MGKKRVKCLVFDPLSSGFPRDCVKVGNFMFFMGLKFVEVGDLIEIAKRSPSIGDWEKGEKWLKIG